MTAWTLEHLGSLRGTIRERQDSDASAARDEAYHPQAALLSSFRLDTGHYKGKAADKLREDSIAVPGDASSFMLKDVVRRRVLRALGTRAAFEAALVAVPHRPTDSLQTLIEAAVKDTLPPLGDQTPQQLVAMLQVADWFADTELAPTLPDANKIRALLERESLLSPMRLLAGKHFQGRKTELAAVRAYIGDRAEERALQRPPLLIFGPGGMGKSALVASIILDNVGLLALAYLDCDRPGIVAMEPVTLLAEIVRQLALQFPEIASTAEHLRGRWLARITAEQRSVPDGRQTVTLGRDTVLKEFNLFVNELPLERGRLLLVIDTFEEVQHLARAVVSEVFSFLDELQASLPGLRTVLAGRNPVPGLTYEPLEIGALDLETARAILASLGVAPAAAVDALARSLRGNPLSLRLAAELWQATDGEDLADVASIADKADVQGILYGRILGHVHDPDVGRIVHPGLMLRRITPDIIANVLAGPCGLGDIGADRAKALFEALREEMSLVEPDGEAVRHRADVRRIMLKPLRQAQGDTATQIERAAIAYYVGIDGPVARAEEIYHRLSLGEAPEIIEARWLPGIDDSLRPALDELEGGSRAYLAARLGVDLYDVELDEADQQTWELAVARQASALLALDKPLEAISLLRRRSARHSSSPLFWLHAQALRRGGFVLEALEVARIGLADLGEDIEHWTGGAAGAEDRWVGRQLAAWYSGPELAETPTSAEVDRERQWLLLLQPLRRSGDRSFVGRRTEMAALDAYVRGLSAAGFEERPPLFVSGPSGIGKSSLLARYILDQQRSLAFVWLDLKWPGEFDVETAIFAAISRQLQCQSRLDTELFAFDPFPSWESLQIMLSRMTELRSGEAPLLIVIDDVDALKAGEHGGFRAIYDLMLELQTILPRLRPVFIGRLPPAEMPFDLLTLGSLDAEATDAFFAAEQVSDTARADIVRLSAAHPLAMRLIADLYHETGEVPDLPDMSESEIKGYLFNRVMTRIADPSVRSIVSAAMVVRRMTVGSLRQVVAPACGVALASDSEAQKLFDRLAREVALFVRNGDGAEVAARPELRRIVVGQFGVSSPDLVLRIHQSAIAFYQKRDGLAERAEELYHRLVAGDRLEQVEERWIDGIEPYLAEALDELTGPSRAILAGKLDRDLKELDWIDADQEAWENYVAMRAAQLLEARRMSEALELLRKRSLRLPRSPLFAIEAKILLGIGQPREALAILDDGLAGIPGDFTLSNLRLRCLRQIGQEEQQLFPGEQSLPISRTRRLAEGIVVQCDNETIVEELMTALPTLLDLKLAWRDRGWEEMVPAGRSYQEFFIKFIDYVTAEGKLVDVLASALHYAPRSSLFSLAERVGLGVPPRPSLLDPTIANGLIFNRVELRRFIGSAAWDMRRKIRLWLVDGPPGSGKSATADIARRVAREIRGTKHVAVTRFRLDRIQSPSEVTQALFVQFGWRWEGAPSEDAPPAMIASRYARMVVDRLDRDAKLKERKHILVFEWELGPAAEDLRDFIWHLAEDGPPLIVTGLPAALLNDRRGIFMETLHDFSFEDVHEALERFANGTNLKGKAHMMAKLILDRARGADENMPFNAKVIQFAREVIGQLEI